MDQAVSSGIPSEGTIYVQEAMAEPSRIQERNAAVSQEDKGSSPEREQRSLLEATGEEPADQLTSVIVKKQSTDEVFALLSKANLDETSVEKAFGNSSEESAEQESAESSEGEDQRDTSNAVTLEDKHNNSGEENLVETKEHPKAEGQQNEENTDEQLILSQKEIPVELAKFLQENPEVEELVKKIRLVSPENREGLLAELNKKINQLIEDEKHPKRKKIKSFLKILLMAILADIIQEVLDAPENLEKSLAA